MIEPKLDGQILPLFATPLYTHKLEHIELENAQNDILPVVEKLYNENMWGQNEQWGSSTHQLSNNGNFQDCIIKAENMINLKQSIMNHVGNYMSHMKVRSDYKSAITSSWLTLTNKGLHAHIHDHGTCHISGVYWYKTNGNDGNIVFRNALKALKCNPIGATFAHENEFSPEEGRIVMWPSFLDHSVNENRSDNDRISLSFNVLLETGITER
jgi:uncharacterized protein (TIGR02466 family)